MSRRPDAIEQLHALIHYGAQRNRLCRPGRIPVAAGPSQPWRGLDPLEQRVLLSASFSNLLDLADPVATSIAHHAVIVVNSATIQDATWAGDGDGVSYNDPDNWGIQMVPCNAGDTEFNMTIPAGSTITHDVAGTCEITTLTLEADATLNVEAGTSLTVTGQADIGGTINATGGDFTALTADFVGNQARVIASDGTQVAIGATSYDSTGLWRDRDTTWDLLHVQGTDTKLDLSAVVSIDAGFDDGDQFDENIQRITAADGDMIDLSRVQTITGPAGLLSDHLEFNIDTGGSVDLSALETTLSAGGGRTVFNTGPAVTGQHRLGRF